MQKVYDFLSRYYSLKSQKVDKYRNKKNYIVFVIFKLNILNIFTYPVKTSSLML